MKLLVLNECYSDNIGDQAIAAAMRNLLMQMGHEPIQIDLSCRTKIAANAAYQKPEWSLKNFVPSPFKKCFFALRTIRTILNELKNPFDGAVIGGGQLILGNSNFPLAIFLWSLALKLLKKDTYIFCAGVGRDFSKSETILYRLAFNRTRKILLRDHESISTLRKIFNVDASYCPDIAYTLSPPPNAQKKEQTCVICITSYSVFMRYHKEMNKEAISHEDYISEWSEITKKYIKEKYRVILSATTEEDLRETINLQRTLSPNASIEVHERVPSVDEFMKLASSASEVVSGRMHALILSHISGAKPRPYEISRKVSDFAREFIHQDPVAIKESIEKKIALTLSANRP